METRIKKPLFSGSMFISNFPEGYPNMHNYLINPFFYIVFFWIQSPLVGLLSPPSLPPSASLQYLGAVLHHSLFPCPFQGPSEIPSNHKTFAGHMSGLPFSELGWLKTICHRFDGAVPSFQYSSIAPRYTT